MSKAIGKALGRYASQNEYGNETMINNYLISQGLPPLANYQANQNMQTNNNFTPVTNMLAQGLQQAHPQEIAEHELDMQIKNLQAQLPNNPALQQQYANMLTQALSAQLNGQAGITNLSQPVMQPQQSNPWAVVQNSLSNDINSVMYGASRALNGLTYGGFDYLGNKFGIDTQMNNYLQNQTAAGMGNVAQTTGNLAEYGGNALPMLIGGMVAASPINMAYNGYKIGKAYDRLSQNPFQGNGSDIIARMRNHVGEPVMLQRGEAIPDNMGNPIVHGNDLKRGTGTYSNYGLNKAIYRHGISREDTQRIPKIIHNKPTETNNYGQNIYLVRSKNGMLRVITSPQNDDNIIASMYYLNK